MAMSSTDSQKSKNGHFLNPFNRYTFEARQGMIKLMARGVSVKDIKFNSPDEFSKLKKPENAVYHPKGGGIDYLSIPGNDMANGQPGKLVFNGEITIENTYSRSGEIIAFLIGVNKFNCLSINEVIGISDIPRLKSDQSALYSKNMIDGGSEEYILPKGEQPYLDHPKLSDKDIGCFQSFDNKDYVVFVTLIKR